MRVGSFVLAARFPGQGDGEALHRAVRSAEVAEEAGLDSVWLAEHHFVPYGTCPSAVTLAALLLGRTRRLRVGTAVSVLPTAHPVALGEQAALLHITSGGRFSLGVGRMFEGTPGPMWAGVKRLRALPDETLVYCGHEYTQSNARFALSIDPDNEALKARAAEVDQLRAAGKATIPFSLGEDKRANPFLRADAPELARHYGLEGADPAEVFAAIRKGKDNF